MKLHATALLGALTLCLSVRADEGMWTFDNLPVKQMQAKYGFTPDPAWLEHVRLSALHFGGGSGSFISKDGLVLTNHHVGRGAVQRLSTKKHDYIKDGFVALTREQELKVPGLTLRTLMHMENVTERVAKAVKPGTPDKEAARLRKEALEGIETELERKHDLVFDAVTLYQGGETWMYGYKVHRDVRLVMAPESQVAFFGGDPDNFTYPRHNLDFTMFRVYEDGKPYHPAHFLKCSTEGLKTGDLTFVIGHPGSTSRLQTYAQMEYDRDFGLPLRIKSLERSRAVLQEYAKRSSEHERQVKTMIFGVENGLKATKGYASGFKNLEAMEAIAKAERELQAKVAQNPRLQAEVGQSWARIQQAMKVQQRLAQEALLVGARGSATLGQALSLVRITSQETKVPENRLPEYTESFLASQKSRLSGPGGPREGAFNPELEKLQFQRGLEEALETLGGNHPFVKAVLGGKRPESLAKAAVDGTRIQDPAFRKELLAGGKKAVEACADPMIVLARRIEPLLLELRRRQDGVKATLEEHGARIAKARFAVYGKSLYPDATSSLRLTYGPVASYPANGTLIQPFTTFGGMYDRHEGWGGNEAKAENGAWTLPQRWLDLKNRLNLATPFCFSHAVDIIGGNSGSPVINRKGELVGLIFDGNIEMLPGRYFYDANTNRGVSVDARALLEAIQKVYEAQPIADEILGKQTKN
jgi:hypothetical protein